MVTEIVVISMRCDFVTPTVYFADQMGEAFCNPAKDEEGCLNLVAGCWVLGSAPVKYASLSLS